MTKLRFFMFLTAAALLLGPGLESAFAQGQFQAITGAAFDSAAPNTVTIEGKNFPVQKRNAAMVQSPSGGRAFLALLDTTGYTTDVAAQKFVGAIVTTGGNLSVGGRSIGAGTYGFGWAVPPAGDEGPGKFSLYTQAGAKLGEVATQRDAGLATPRPLQVVVLKNGTAQLYFGRHSVELR